MPVLLHIDKAETDPLRASLEEFLDAGRKAQRTFWLARASIAVFRVRRALSLEK